MTTQTYTSGQFADALEYLFGIANNVDYKELLLIHKTLRGLPNDRDLEVLARNTSDWSKIIEKNSRLCLPEHKECLAEFTRSLKAEPTR